MLVWCLNMISCFRILVVFFTFLDEGANIRIAVTGAILVKDKYAIANADDVSKIPRRIFRGDSKAMFIPTDDTPWTCKLKDSIAHPEYEYSILNTIAIVELELEEDGIMPVTPICWPEYMYNASNQLFALGYTDDNQLLEKVVYRVQYVQKSLCEEFYNRAGLQDHRQVPTHYDCGFPENNTQNCQWDNGMVLAANSSSTWVLIGLGIRGPSCSTPVRFIQMYQYLPWIEQVTDNQLSDYSLRKASLPTENKIQDIPIHNFFRAGRKAEPTDQTNKQAKAKRNKPFDIPREITWDMYDKEHSQLYDIERIDKDAIVLATFNNKYEQKKGDCFSQRSSYLIYKESVKVQAYSNLIGVGTYKLALMDLAVQDYTCILIRLVSTNHSLTSLYFKTEIDIDEPLQLPDRTPDFLMKKYPQVKELEIPRSNSKNTTLVTAIPSDAGIGSKWTPHDNLEAQAVTDIPRWWNGFPNMNLFLTFHFVRHAELKLEVWGSEVEQPTTSTVVPTRTLTKKKSYKKAEVHESHDVIEVAEVVEADRNFDIKHIRSDSARVKSFCAMVILFSILIFDK